jgi:hypothetical protein
MELQPGLSESRKNTWANGKRPYRRHGEAHLYQIAGSKGRIRCRRDRHRESKRGENIFLTESDTFLLAQYWMAYNFNIGRLGRRLSQTTFIRRWHFADFDFSFPQRRINVIH